MLKILTDMFLYMIDIPNSACTITGPNLIKGVVENIYLEEPVRVASPTRNNLKEPVRVASPTRINLEEP